MVVLWDALPGARHHVRNCEENQCLLGRCEVNGDRPEWGQSSAPEVSSHEVQLHQGQSPFQQQCFAFAYSTFAYLRPRRRFLYVSGSMHNPQGLAIVSQTRERLPIAATMCSVQRVSSGPANHDALSRVRDAKASSAPASYCLGLVDWSLVE